MSHRPLCRVSRGPKVTVGPLDPPDPPHRLHPPRMAVDGTPRGRNAEELGKKNSAELQDSCYSSCSESEHSSLSRNTSAASETLAQEYCSLTNLTQQLSLDPVPPQTPYPNDNHYNKMVDFTLKLGYSEQQLHNVLVQFKGVWPPNQDQVLALLIAQGPMHMADAPSSTSVQPETSSQLRAIVIDGSNLAITHGHKEIFSCVGIRDCVNFFRDRGHQDIKVFVPHFRQETPRHDCPIVDQHILFELEKDGVLVWTPSRRVGGRRIVCHDDRYILKTASEKDAVIVSNDEYRDLMKESPDMRRLVEERLLMYSFVDGKFMPPDDPLGRHGPKLDQFLRKGGSSSSAPLCPYGRKCTYGNKCKFFHPERPGGVHVSVSDRLMDRHEYNKRQLSSTHSLKPVNEPVKQTAFRTHSLNLPPNKCHSSEPPYFPPPQQHSYHSPPPPPCPSSSYLHPSHCQANWSWTPPSNHHPPITRIASAPGKPDQIQNVPSKQWSDERVTVESSSSSTSDSQLFVPSPTVWGAMENSVSPVPPGPPDDGTKCTTFFHLCGLFPEALVRSVMASNPKQTNPTVLCALCVAAQTQHNFQ